MHVDAIPSRRSMVRILWLLGLFVSLAPFGWDLWRLRRLRRGALPWPDTRSKVAMLARDAGVAGDVCVALHEEVATPVTFGMRRATILMPIDARTWSDDDLRRALVHELEHARRRDWLTHVFARLACGIYWFHPLAWAVRRRLVLDAERACDNAVVIREEDVAYAEQLVSLAERISTSTIQPLLGMAHRSELSARVSGILDGRQSRGRLGGRGVASVVVAGAITVGLVAPVRAVARPDALLSAITTATPERPSQRHRPTSRDRALLEAAGEGNLSEMDALVRAGADVNASIEGDGSALIAAAKTGRVSAVRWLLDRGASPNLGVEGDGSPLIAAASSGSVEVAALLLDHGASIEQVVRGDENALITACGAGELGIVRLLIDRHADINARVWAERYDGRGEWRTPMSMARRGSHTEIVSLLLAAGARE